jgi:DNA end-binding protein Ku
MAPCANWKGYLKLSLAACARFNLSKFEDRYEAALKELIAAKRAGKTPPTPPSPRSTNVVSLMDALRRGVQAERGGASGGRKAQKRAAARPAPLRRASAKHRRAS